MSETENTGTELALFPKLNLPSVTGITEQMNKSFGTMYTRIEEGIAKLPTDMSVKANREKVASYAYSISRTKTGLDEAAASVSGDAKKIVDAVNAERRQLKNTLDILRDKARERLDAWQAIEESRAVTADQAVSDLSKTLDGFEDSGTLSVMLDNLQSWEITEEIYGEHVERVMAAHLSAVERIDKALDARRIYEAEQAELEQLRREKAEREAAEAARIAEEERKTAEAAEIARQEEERARIAKAAKEKAARDAAEAIQRAEDEKAEAQRRAEEAEKREAQRIEDDKRRAIEQEEARKEAAARAEEVARRREEEARAAERQRIANEALAKERADKERAADLAHRKHVNTEAVAGLVKACGLTEKDAQAVVIAIYKEQVPHVAITY